MQSSRAGIYGNQVGGYKSFTPKPLPPDPPIQLDEEMIHLLSLVERALGRLDGTSGILPNVDLFVAMYVNKEADYYGQQCCKGNQFELCQRQPAHQHISSAPSPTTNGQISAQPALWILWLPLLIY